MFEYHPLLNAIGYVWYNTVLFFPSITLLRVLNSVSYVIRLYKQSIYMYRQTSNISSTLAGNKIVDH